MNKKIEEPEGKNELAREILLHESAIYETQVEISKLDKELNDHPKIQEYVRF